MRLVVRLCRVKMDAWGTRRPARMENVQRLTRSFIPSRLGPIFGRRSSAAHMPSQEKQKISKSWSRAEPRLATLGANLKFIRSRWVPARTAWNNPQKPEKHLTKSIEVDVRWTSEWTQIPRTNQGIHSCGHREGVAHG